MSSHNSLDHNYSELESLLLLMSRQYSAEKKSTVRSTEVRVAKWFVINSFALNCGLSRNVDEIVRTTIPFGVQTLSVANVQFG